MALSFVKKRPATDSQIRKHREQARVHRQWKDDVDQIKAITTKLSNVYRSHKGDFALGRYEELKQMIKDSVKNYKELMDKTQKHSRDGAASLLASKYSSGGQGQTNTTPQSQSNGSNGGGGLFSKLKKKAADFASSSSSSSTQPKEERTADMGTWGYEGRSGKDIEAETESMRKEMLQLKVDFRSERDKLDRLAKEYEDSKKHAPPQRYTVLKYMIKDVIGA